MSDFSLTLVLQIKTSKIINDMPKVQQESEKITAFGGICFVLDKFDSILSSVIVGIIHSRQFLIGTDYILGTTEHGFYKEAAALVAQAIPKNKCVIIPKKYATVPALKL